MDHQIIEQIVREVFEKVKPTSASHKKNALSHKIQEKSTPRISYKTAERAYEKYIDEIEMDWSPNRISVTNFCKFLKYKDYEDYVSENFKQTTDSDAKEVVTTKDDTPTQIEIKKTGEEEKDSTVSIKTGDSTNIGLKPRKRKWIFIFKMTFTFGMVLFTSIVIIKNSNSPKQDIETNNSCMAWNKDHYEEISCDLSVHPKFRTKVEPLVLNRMKMMKKVGVDIGYPFFEEKTGKPLVWYYKTKKGEIEYYSSPGLHPINGETLKKITRTIIQKYVPIHHLKPDSFF